MKKELVGVGLGLSFFAFIPFFLMFLDLFLFTPRPWPYSDGGGWEHIILYSSLFWTQYIAHCHFFVPTLLSQLIWRYWVIPFGFGLSLITITVRDLESHESRPFLMLEKFSSSGWTVVFLAHVFLYFFYGSHSSIVLSSLGLLLFMPILVIFPLMTFFLTYRCLVKKTPLSFLFWCLWLIVDFIFSLFASLLLFGGCI